MNASNLLRLKAFKVFQRWESMDQGLAVNLTVSNAVDFLHSKARKSIRGNQSTPRIFAVEVESSCEMSTTADVRTAIAIKYRHAA